MGTLTKPLSLKDQVSFQCRLCGDCCRGLEGQLMLEPPDAYRLGRHLRASGAVAEIEDVYAKYAHVSMLAEGIPIFLMNTVFQYIHPNHRSFRPFWRRWSSSSRWFRSYCSGKGRSRS